MAKREISKKVDFWLVCFKYAPGNWQHIESFTVRAEENGFTIRLILSKLFSWMTGSFSDRATYVTRSDTILSILLDTILFFLYRWISLGLCLYKEKPRAIILVMWHPLNAVFCLMAKLAGSQIVVWLHEPYKSNKLDYGAKAIVFYMVEWLQSLAMYWIDDVVVHSEMGLRAFRNRYPRAKQTLHLIPLQFLDQPHRQSKRRSVSFLGKAAKAKGIDVFFELIEVCSARNLDWKFTITTCDNINKHLEKMSLAARKNLEVVSAPHLSDVVLRETASKSLTVLCLYVNSMQSGVIPLAFMCGTPVIATDIEALRTFVSHCKTGYFVPRCPGPDAILEGLEYINSNFAHLSENCRREFLNNYNDRKWKDAYSWLCDENYPINTFQKRYAKLTARYWK